MCHATVLYRSCVIKGNVCVCVCVYLLVCLLALKEGACHGESKANSLCCCSPVVECFRNINVNVVNVREREDGDWTAIMLGYNDETDWD